MTTGTVRRRIIADHGTRARYVTGCRCLPCRAANATYNNRRDRLRAYGRPTTDLVDAGPVREHIRALSAAGMGRRQLARVSGVANSVLVKILYGDAARGMPPSRRVRPATAARILGVQAPVRAPSALVDSAGTVRRLRALVAVGWPQARLAERIGWTDANLSALIRGERAQVEQRTADAVVKLYDQLWQVSPEGLSAARARRHAARRGWAGPLAWDDETIDDPAAGPDRGPSRAPMGEVDPAAVEALVAGRLTAADVRPAERYAAILELAREGRSSADIAAWIRTTERTVLRARAAGRVAS